jgi:hypothetical protein
MDQLNFTDLPPARVTCDACGTTWTSTAAWYTNGRAGCYQCFPDEEPTRDDVARAAGRRHATAAADAATIEWRIEARQWLEGYLLDHPTLFVDDIWELGCPEPVERRAIGALIQGLARKGYIVKSGEYRSRTQGHGSPADVWRSLIYEGQRSA